MVGFARDIAKQLEADRALEAARDEALAMAEAKSRFVAVMSHEMRTPLNGVLGTLDMMRDSGLTPAQAKLVETALTSVGVLNQRIDDVLDLSRIQADKLDLVPSAFHADELIDEVRTITLAAATAPGNRVTVEAFPSPPRFWADRKRLLRTSNAIKFTRNGEILTRWRRRDRERRGDPPNFDFRHRHRRRSGSARSHLRGFRHDRRVLPQERGGRRARASDLPQDRRGDGRQDRR